MPGLDEHEILERLKEAFREAIEAARLTGNSTERGMHYITLQNAMRVLEGCSRQIAVCRDDAIWHEFALKVGTCTKKCGEWLRLYPPTVHGNPAKVLFDALADMLESKLKESNNLRYNATGGTGTRLPEWMPSPRPQYGRSAGGIILPPGYSVH